MVTNLPSPKPEVISPLTDKGDCPTLPLSIIPPKKERIISAIDKIYNVINISTKDDDLSPTKRQETCSSNSTYSVHKRGKDETLSKIKCNTNISKCKDEQRVIRQELDVTKKIKHGTVSAKDTERAGRLYRFFLSRNRTMDPSESSVTTQLGVVNTPKSFHGLGQLQVEESLNHDLVINVPSSNEQTVSTMVKPIPESSGVKRRSQETCGHEQNKIRKTSSSNLQDDQKIANVYTSSEASTNWIELQAIPTITQTVVSLIVPVAVYPTVSVDPSAIGTQLEMQHESLLHQVRPLSQIVLQQALETLISPLTMDNQLDPAETPEQALKDLEELPEVISKCNYNNYCLYKNTHIKCTLTNNLCLLQITNKNLNLKPQLKT